MNQTMPGTLGEADPRTDHRMRCSERVLVSASFLALAVAPVPGCANTTLAKDRL
jgi:hypothetical protein